MLDECSYAFHDDYRISTLNSPERWSNRDPYTAVLRGARSRTAKDQSEDECHRR